MKAITEYTDQEYAEMQMKYRALQRALEGIELSKRHELFTFQRRPGYAKYDFNGAYTDKLVEALGGRHPDAEEIIMLVDSGYSHFGASCIVNTRDKSFSGYVYID